MVESLSMNVFYMFVGIYLIHYALTLESHNPDESDTDSEDTEAELDRELEEDLNF